MAIKLIVEVDDITSITITEDSHLIEGLEIVRKFDDDISQLVAHIECGECYISFCNVYNDFNVLNASSTYARIKNGQKCTVFNDSTVIFTGFIADYKAPTTKDGQTCNICLVDRMYPILNTYLTLADMQITSKISLALYLDVIFKLVGLIESEYVIDESLQSLELKYTLIKGYKVAEQLDEICKAADLYIYADSVGIVRVLPKTITGNPTMTIERNKDNNCLKKSEYGESVFSSYATLKVGYTTTKLSDVKELLSLKEQQIQQGNVTLENNNLNTENLYELDNIRVLSENDTLITAVSSTASTITMTLNNPTVITDTVDIIVSGKMVELSTSFIVKQLNTKEVEQTLAVESVLIQKKAYATELADKLFARASEKIPYITAEVSDVKNFTLDLGNVVTIIDSDVDLTYTGYVHTLTAEYTGTGDFDYMLGIKRSGVV